MKRTLALGGWMAAVAGALGAFAVAPAVAENHVVATTAPASTTTTSPAPTTTTAPAPTTTTAPATTTTGIAPTTTTPLTSTTVTTTAGATTTTTAASSQSPTAGRSTTTTTLDTGDSRLRSRERSSKDVPPLPPDPRSSISPPDLGDLFTKEAPPTGNAPEQGSTRGLLTGGLGASVVTGLLLGLRDRATSGGRG